MATRLVVPSLTAVREAAVTLLTEHQRPIYYIELAGMVLTHLEWNFDADLKRAVAEDLREKILEAGQQGLGYSGKPHYLAWFKRWLPAGRTLFSDSKIPIPITRDAALMAAIEGMLRFEHILNKKADGKEAHAARIANGFIIEKTVSNWFRLNWPGAWQPPQNERRWAEWCDHDFRLSLAASSRVLKVDVAGPGADGLVGVRYGGKPRAELHIIAEGHHLGVAVIGYETGETFADALRRPIQGLSPEIICVLLNAETRGIPFFKIMGGFEGLAGKR